MLSLIPISDVNPTRRFPIVTVTLIAANIAAFFYSLNASGGRLTRYFFEHAPVPCQLANECPGQLGFGPGNVIDVPTRGFGSFLVAVLVSTFLHANLLHIAGNMLFLWVFGNNVEDWLGRGKYVAFYLAGGIIAAFAHVAWSLVTSPARAICTQADFGACVPAVGASGTVAAVMGAYLVLYPRARVNVLVPIFFLLTMIQMSAFAVLGLWFVYQFLIGLQELAGPSGVAWTAHVGGFVYGLVLIFLLGGRPHRRPSRWVPRYRY
ncbi:MAG: rhomboid family intramembrane serine protease [Actinomycetota bacterium]